MAPPLAVSVIVPTFREADNIRPLASRIFAATSAAQIEAELILVDDNSQDGTEGIVAALAQHHPIRVIVRRTERGLSGAVLTGFAHARFDRFVVLDADLQHPPEAIPELLGLLEADDCDFAIATRYAGGSVEYRWPWYRLAASRLATWLAHPLVPLSDPMSGFFALSRETWLRADHPDPAGFKIALELYVKARCRHPLEWPIHFGTRHSGRSKLGVRVQIRYLAQLLKLYEFCYPRRTKLVRWSLAAIVALVMIVLCKSLLSV